MQTWVAWSCMLFQHFDRELTPQVLFFIFCPAIIWTFERPVLKMHIFWYRTDICSCNLSGKVSLMLDNPFPVSSLRKLNHISIWFISISTKITSRKLISFKESDPRCFEPLGKFQILSFRFLWLWLHVKNIKRKLFHIHWEEVFLSQFET